MAQIASSSKRSSRHEDSSSRESSRLSAVQLLRKQGYKIGRVIGSGSYSKVHVAYKVLDNGEQLQVACKIVNRKTASPDFVAKFLPREIDVIRQIEHPHVVKFFDVFDFTNHVYMFVEYCKKGDLLQHIQNGGSVEEARARRYFRQMVSAVQYLHSLEIAHRDLKCENILMSWDNSVKITDFGFSRRLRDESGRMVLSETFCGSKSYAAPEVLQNRPYNPKMSDAWSLGCILHVMVTACLPFPESNVKKLLTRQQNRLVGFGGRSSKPLSDEVRRLIRRILEPNIAARATVDQMASDVWVNGIATSFSDNSQQLQQMSSSQS